MDRKGCSLTQPGRGICKIIDLYHDLPDLVDNAKKYAAIHMLDPREIEEIDCIDFVGLTEDQIEDERKECVTKPCDLGVTDASVSVSAASVATEPCNS